MGKIYLDYNATTPLDEEVKCFYFEKLEKFANASSLYEDGRILNAEIQKAREQVAKLINAKSEELLFTSGGSESNNAVFATMLDEAKKSERNLIVTTKIEHPSVLESAKNLEKLGLKTYFVNVDRYGVVDIEDYKKALSQKPLFVSVMMANNEIGTIQDIKMLCELAHNEKAFFHTDAVQATGKIPIDVHNLDVDYLTMSAHKIYAPKGIGTLFVKSGKPFLPFIRGGHQEKSLRAGTYNAPAIIAFGRAAELALQNLDDYQTHTRKLRNALRDKLLASLDKIHINGHPDKVLPNTLNVSFFGAEGESILLHLDLLGIEVSTGSACASGSLEPSHVLLATGLDSELAHGSIRLSFGKYSTMDDVDFVAQSITKIIKELRAISTVL